MPAATSASDQPSASHHTRQNAGARNVAAPLGTASDSMGKAAVRSALRRMTCSAVPSTHVAVGCGINTLAIVNRYGLSRCDSEKSEMERRSSGSGVRKYGGCGIEGERLGHKNSGAKARRIQTRKDVTGTMV